MARASPPRSSAASSSPSACWPTGSAMVMGDLVREVDVVVVGGGPGGYSAAFRCAELGLETVVVDAGKRLGGACLFEGCIPSKALLHVAAVLGEAERAKEFGVDFGPARVSLDPLRKWKSERVIARLARGLVGVARSKGVEVVGGRGVFEDARTVRVEGDQPQALKFRHVIVATGSAPARLRGVEPSERVMDSTAALEVPEVPERLLVVGGGYIGLELGQVYAALGSAVTLVEMTDGLLPGADRRSTTPSCPPSSSPIRRSRGVASPRPGRRRRDARCASRSSSGRRRAARRRWAAATASPSWSSIRSPGGCSARASRARAPAS